MIRRRINKPYDDWHISCNEYTTSNSYRSNGNNNNGDKNSTKTPLRYYNYRKINQNVCSLHGNTKSPFIFPNETKWWEKWPKWGAPRFSGVTQDPDEARSPRKELGETHRPDLDFSKLKIPLVFAPGEIRGEERERRQRQRLRMCIYLHGWFTNGGKRKRSEVNAISSL